MREAVNGRRRGRMTFCCMACVGPICTLAVSDVSTMPKPFAADSDTSDAIKR